LCRECASPRPRGSRLRGSARYGSAGSSQAQKPLERQTWFDLLISELQWRRSGGDWSPMRPPLLLRAVEDLVEAAPEHALAGERHLALGLEALVGHDRLPGFVASG